MKIIAFDPGHLTGVAKVSFNEEEVHEYADLWKLEIKTDTLYPQQVFDEIIDNYNLIIIESFRVYPTANLSYNDLLPSRLIGALEYKAHVAGVPVIFQSASEGKAFFTDKKLLNANVEFKSIHEKDATRHLLHYLVKNFVRRK